VSDTTDEPNRGGIIREHDDSILFMLSGGCITYPAKDLRDQVPRSDRGHEPRRHHHPTDGKTRGRGGEVSGAPKLTPLHRTAHVGLHILETLKALGMTQKHAADQMQISTKHLNRVIKAQSGISADLAIRIEALTGVPAEFWMRLQVTYDVQVARLRAQVVNAATHSAKD
jgi:addiction module HigA family antidote